MVKKSGLGKGFGSLLPEDFDKSLLLDKKDRVQKINLSDLSPDPSQPRKFFDEAKLAELSVSIKNYGLLQPIVVRAEAGKYIIIAGERRYRAAKLAGLSQIPALVHSPKELERIEIGLVENVQRVDLSPLEQAVSIAKLTEQFNLSVEEISQKLGKAKSTVVNIVRLLKLPPKAQRALEENKISEGHARTILSLENNHIKQSELLNSIIKKHWSVRQAEAFASSEKISPAGSKNKPLAKDQSASKALSKKLKAEVVVVNKAVGGHIKINFKNDSDYKRITKLLS